MSRPHHKDVRGSHQIGHVAAEAQQLEAVTQPQILVQLFDLLLQRPLSDRGKLQSREVNAGLLGGGLQVRVVLVASQVANRECEHLVSGNSQHLTDTLPSA